MAPPSPLWIFIAVGSVVFVVGGVIAFSRPSVTVYHIPRLVLVLLTITTILWGVVGVAASFLYAEILATDSGPGLGVDFTVAFYPVLGAIGTFVFMITSLFKSFKMSTSILTALGSVTVLAVGATTTSNPFGGPPVLFGVLIGAPALIGTLTWVALRISEKSAERDFRERMKT